MPFNCSRSIGLSPLLREDKVRGTQREDPEEVTKTASEASPSSFVRQ